MGTATENPTTTAGSIQASLRRRRSAHAHRRVLEAELAAFVTPAERLEIEMIVDRYSDEVSKEIRDILQSRDVPGYRCLGRR